MAVQIMTTGFQDFLDDSSNIRSLVIGGPGVGKTRWSSFWPKPLLIDCEGNRGSLRDRAMPFARVRSSKDMLDVLEFAKAQCKLPVAQRKYRTFVVDTADSFQRIVKEEWVTANNAGSFSGYDAWGYLDQKMQLLFTRLLNLDANVVVLVHYKEKTSGTGDDRTTQLGLQLQGAIADQIFNDFGLVGWMGTYWDAGPNGREQKRGLTFTPTPDKPFLKDTFGITPPWMPIDLGNEDSFQDLLGLFMAELEGGEELPDQQVLEAVPEVDPSGVTGDVVAPFEGGALAERPPVEVPLEKRLKGDLEKLAKELGIEVRGNTLKGELVKAIQAKQAELASTPAAETPTGEASADPAPASSDSETPTSPTSTSPGGTDPWTGKPVESAGSSSSEPASSSDAESSAAAPPAAESSSDAVALVQAELGGEVILDVRADAPDTSQPAQPEAPKTPAATSGQAGPSICAGCGADLAPFWASTEGTQALRKSFIKHRSYRCPDCS